MLLLILNRALRAGRIELTLLAKSRSRILFSVVLGGAAFLASGCVHALGPGFHFNDRQSEIRVSPSEPGRIRFHIADQLQNDGNRTLHSLDVRLPAGPATGAQNLRLLIEGSQVSPERGSPEDVRMMVAPFAPEWKMDDTRKVVTEWDVVPGDARRVTMATSPQGFFVADSSVFPQWQTPSGPFARGGTAADKELLTVFAPPDFRILAPGKPLKPGRDGAQNVRRFVIYPGNDSAPYVVAGRYQVQSVDSRRGRVEFWLFHPVDRSQAQAAADRLSFSMNAFADYFGGIPRHDPLLRVAESPVELPDEFGAESDPGGLSFPEGAMLDSRAFQQGWPSEASLQLAEYELARTWFGWRVRPRPEAQILMGRGVGLFGLVIAAETRGQDQRRAMVASLMGLYDQARAEAPDKRLMEPPVGYSRAERISTGYRGVLFMVALEDLCGYENLRSALRDIVHDRAASDTGYEELRSAVETASGKDLAEMFRQWLIQPGIPDDFRAKYQH